MRKIAKTAALAAALGLGTIASAQLTSLTNQSDYYPYNFTLRAGVGLPFDSKTSDTVGSSLIALGVEYTFGEPLLKGGDSYIALDWMAKSFKGEKGTIMPLTLNHRFYTGLNGLRRSYFFVGAGVAFIDVNSQNTAVAARAGLGTELGDHVIFETSALFSDKAAGVSANSVAFYLGYRF